jgi:hypothetical protein
VNSALFTLRTALSSRDRRLVGIRLVGPKSAAEKAALLRRALEGQGVGIVSTPRQADFLPIAETPFVYWLRPRSFELLQIPRRLFTVADVRQRMATTDNLRFIRFFWECSESGVWVPYAKGGGYKKWAGFENYCLDWNPDGIKLKAAVEAIGGQHWSRRIVSADRFFSPGLTYTQIALGNMGC